jgi:hypothetical protein
LDFQRRSESVAQLKDRLRGLQATHGTDIGEGAQRRRSVHDRPLENVGSPLE